MVLGEEPGRGAQLLARAEVPIAEEDVLQLQGPAPGDHQVRVAPPRAGAIGAVHVAVADVDPADERRVPVDHRQFAVVAVVEAVGQQQQAHPVEGMGLHPRGPQRPHVAPAYGAAAVVVVDHPHLHALLHLAGQHLQQAIGQGAPLPDVVFQVDVVAGPLHGLDQRGELLLAVDQQARGVVAGEHRAAVVLEQLHQPAGGGQLGPFIEHRARHALQAFPHTAQQLLVADELAGIDAALAVVDAHGEVHHHAHHRHEDHQQQVGQRLGRAARVMHDPHAHPQHHQGVRHFGQQEQIDGGHGGTGT